MGLSRDRVYMTSSVKCWPPNNRTPHANELEICKGAWLNQQISLVNPELIVLLVRASLYQMLGEKNNIGNLHGRILQRNARNYLATFHPAAAMRFPQMRRKMVQDLEGNDQLSKVSLPHRAASDIAIYFYILVYRARFDWMKKRSVSICSLFYPIFCIGILYGGHSSANRARAYWNQICTYRADFL